MNRNFNDLHRYDDIINLAHRKSKIHKPMPLIDRAAQFAPFSALSGHEEAIRETARLTKAKPLLDENQKTILDIKLNYILQHLKQNPVIKITYFKKDSKKSGGSLVIAEGIIDKINYYDNNIIMQDKTRIAIGDIIIIDGDIFNDLDF